MKHPWMPLFNGDLLSDTMHLSAQEFGAYMLLIIHAWKHDARIVVANGQRIARVGNRHWARVRTRLAPFFEPPDGLLGGALEVTHRRVAKELAYTEEISSKNRQAALQMHANRRANAVQPHMPPPSQPLKELSLGEEGNGTTVRTHERQGPSPDLGNSYRAPPANRNQDPPMTSANREALAKLNSHRLQYPPDLSDDEKRLIAIEPNTWTPARILAQRNQSSGR